MLVLLISAVSILVYLGVGVLNARYTYAIAMTEAEGRQPLYELEVEYSDKKIEYHRIYHYSHCNMSYSSLKYKGCDCDNKDRWWGLRSEISALKTTIDSYPAVKVKHILFWWLTMIDRFIKGGYRPAPKTEEQKLNEWVGYDFVKNDPRYDNSHNETWNAINEKYNEDVQSGHPLAIRAQNLSDKIRRAAMPDPDPSKRARKITTSLGPK